MMLETFSDEKIYVDKQGGITETGIIKPTDKEVETIGRSKNGLMDHDLIRFKLTGELPDKYGDEIDRKLDVYQNYLDHPELPKSASQAVISEGARSSADLGVGLLSKIHKGEVVQELTQEDLRNIQYYFFVAGKEAVNNMENRLDDYYVACEVLDANYQTSSLLDTFSDTFFLALIDEYIDPEQQNTLEHEQALLLLNTLQSIYANVTEIDVAFLDRIDAFVTKISKTGINQSAPDVDVTQKANNFAALLKGKSLKSI